MVSNSIEKRKFFIILFVLTFLIYGNTIKNDYALDDAFVTVTLPKTPNNPRIEKGLSGIPEIFTTHYVETKQQSFEYRPLVLASFAVEYQFFKSNAHISHFFNVLIYAITNILLFILLAKLFKNYGHLFPFLITCVFLAHPIHTEVVANIKCRDELLSFLFGILTTFFLFKHYETKKVPYLLFSMMFLLCGLLCKKTAEIFLVFGPTSLYFFSKANLKQLLFYIFILYIPLLCFDFIENGLLEDTSGLRVFAFFENPLFYEQGFFNRFPIAFYTLGYYVKLLLLPYPLSCYYGYSVIPLASLTSPFVIASLLFYIFMIAYAVKTFTQKSILAYSIAVFLIGILPFSNIIFTPAGIVADRYIYFASLGFCIAIVYILAIFFKTNFKANSIKEFKMLNFSFSIVITLTVLIFALLSISRNTKWKDEITLFRNDVKNFKNSCNLHYILGNKLYPQIFSTPNGIKKDSLINETKFHFSEAVSLMKEGVKKYPNDYTTLNNIGTIYVNIFNDPYSAQPFFKKSLEINPDNIEANYNYAFCFEKKNLKDSAITSYENLISKKIKYLPVYLQLRELYINKGEFQKAILCDQSSILAYPNNAKLYINLGNAYINNKDTVRAIEHFENAIRLEPTNTEMAKQINSFIQFTSYKKTKR